MDGDTSEGDPGEIIALPAAANAPEIARQYVRRNCDGLPQELLADAEIMVSELVTNALQYGRPQITLHLRSDPPGVGIGVADDGPPLGPGPRGHPEPSEPRGRGLMIVDALASTWGVTAHDPLPGKTVWFQLRPDSPR
jgi:anti-sigma regulatory factor (Ser/Thr protein kinase)